MTNLRGNRNRLRRVKSLSHLSGFLNRANSESLMSKKVKLIKVVVKADYRVLLYDEKQKNLKP